MVSVEESEKLWRIRSYFLRHFHMRHNTMEDSERIREEITRLEIWGIALSKRWFYHRHREWNDERSKK